MEYDPRTGEPKKEMPLAARMAILIICLGIAAYILYDVNANRDATGFDTQRMAYNTVHDVRRMQSRFHSNNGRYATLQELKDTGWFDHEIEGNVAHCDYGIKVHLTLTMDRQDYDLEVEYRRGIYRSGANDINEFNDYERDPMGGGRR